MKRTISIAFGVSLFILGGSATADPGATGPHAICSYTSNLANAGYSSARLSYPCGLSSPAPATTLTGGFTNTKEDMYWLADHLTTHGYIVLTITPNNILGMPPVWKTAHIAGFGELADENGRAGSPVYQKVQLDKRAITGFSMGGGGTLLAAGEMGSGFATAIALAPWLGIYSPNYLNIEEPTMILGSANDILALPVAVGSYYESLPSDIVRALAIYRNTDHFDWYGSGASSEKTRFRTLVTAWMDWLLKGDGSAQDYFDGPEHDQHLAEDWFTRFEFRP